MTAALAAERCYDQAVASSLPMSEEQFKAFQKKVNDLKTLEHQLQSATDVNAVVAIAKEAGFSITVGDLKNALSELTEDEQLEHATGGGPTAVAGWIVLNLVTAGIPAMIDLANGSPYAKEAMESKY